jgi:hypothetical protein
VKALLGLKAPKESESFQSFVNMLKKAIPALEANPSNLDPKQIERLSPHLTRTVRAITALLKSQKDDGAGQP